MDLLGHLEHILVFVEEILIIKKVGELENDHMKKIEQMLERLDVKGSRATVVCASHSFYVETGGTFRISINRLGVNSYFARPIFRPQNSKNRSIHNSKKLDLD